MKRQCSLILALSMTVLVVLAAQSQPPKDFEKKGPPFEKKGPPRYELGKVLPPFVRESLELTPVQQKQIADLEREVKEKLTKILNDDQKRLIETLRPGPPPGKKGPPDDGPDPKEKVDVEPPVVEDLPAPRIKAPERNLIKNARFTAPKDGGSAPLGFTVKGNAEWIKSVHPHEFSPSAIALRSGGSKSESLRAGSVSQDVVDFAGGAERWFRFSFRGLAENGFTVNDDALTMKAEFFGKKGADPLDGVTRKIYALVERDRENLAVNGNDGKNGAAVWRTYALDFKLPFAEIDLLRLSVGFENGTAVAADASFYVADWSLIPIPRPDDVPTVVKTAKGLAPARENLFHLGGRWYYDPEPGLKEKPTQLTIDATNAHRLYYLDDRLTNPFTENMSAWLRAGHKDINGRLVETDRFVPDNVILRFVDNKTLIVRAKNIPNHPTGQFPERFEGGRNRSFIQEHDYTYYLPLNPVVNPKAIAMDKTNSNRALPMGAIGIAVNGVVFYNPFDMGNRDASSLMDRCCGHPSPDNRYHYHKYPVCVKSPFNDTGDEHSPLIGFSLDGFPIYGPYESKGVLAKNSTALPLNEFNIHHDEAHGWHYHVTPGQYPYVIGGYWGEVDRRNFAGKGPGFGPKE